MQTSTTLTRWLAVAFIVFGVTGTASAQRTVTLRLNTATVPDTLDALDEIQVRGQLGSGTALPGGGVIDWNDSTTLRPANVGGDYWDLSFQIPDDDALQFKFYADLLEQAGLGGWEDGDNTQVAAGTGDVDLGTHYFVKGDGQPYDWTPFDTPAGKVGVQYRVFMCTVDGANDLYVPSNQDMIVGVRGAPDQGVIDWGATNVQLSQESATEGEPGWDTWSGIAYYDAAMAGTQQEYKYVVETANVGWEDSDNRKFTIPAADTTLSWVYYGNDTPTQCAVQPELATVIFAVDLTPLQNIGLFEKSRGDTLQVRGGFNGWNCDNPDDCLLLPFPGTNIFEAAVPVTALPGSDAPYKFFIDFNDENFLAAFGALPPSGWEEPLSTTGANRTFTFEGGSGQQFLGDRGFNDIHAGNVIAAGTSVDVTFNVDMSGAASAADPFDPAVHTVYPSLTGDAIWAFTQGIERASDGVGFNTDARHAMTDPDGDGIYSGTITVTGPTYSALQYTFVYGADNLTLAGVEAGGGFDGLGRRRTRYIQPNPDGSWPSAQAFPTEVFTPEGDLPFENNPASPTAIESIGDELPQRVALDQNYPNPFNPTTAIEYSIDTASNVRLQVFDILGRVVATLVDGQQPASTYRVTLDATQLASGTYIYRLTTPHQTLTRTMVLMK
jgi:type IX secretion system substrate protein